MNESSKVINKSSFSQIHNRYEGKDISKHKRNLVIAGGVTLSVIVSPVVAAVTVGKKKVLFSLSLPTPSAAQLNLLVLHSQAQHKCLSHVCCWLLLK